MVPQGGTRMGGGALRQRLLGGRSGRAIPGVWDLPDLRKLAAGVHSDGIAGTDLGVRVEGILPSSGNTSEPGAGRTDHVSGGARRREARRGARAGFRGDAARVLGPTA